LKVCSIEDDTRIIFQQDTKPGEYEIRVTVFLTAQAPADSSNSRKHLLQVFITALLLRHLQAPLIGKMIFELLSMEASFLDLCQLPKIDSR